ncbi:MAG: hypothetical protein ACRDHX_07345 [Chloroflexota bacterium]
MLSKCTAILAASLLCSSLAGCGGGSPASRPATVPPSMGLAGATAPATVGPGTQATAATALPEASLTSSPDAGAGRPAKLTNDNWGMVEYQATITNLSQFTGIPVEISGQVFNIEQDATRLGVQIWVYPTRGQGNTVVVFAKAGNPAVTAGQTIQVTGTLDGELVRQTSQGQTLHLPRVAATQVLVGGHVSARRRPRLARVSGPR